MKTEVTRIFDILPHYKENFKPKDDVVVGGGEEDPPIAE